MLPSQNLKTRIAETLDEINPLIVWHLHHARKRFFGLSFFVLAVVTLGVYRIHLFPFENVRQAIELFCWIYSWIFSICFAACSLPDAEISQDEFMADLEGLTPLEKFHGELVLALLPVFGFWAINFIAVAVFSLFFHPIFESMIAVTLPPLFLTACAFAFSAINTLYFKGFLDFSIAYLSGGPILIALLASLIQIVFCLLTSRNYLAYTISLLFFLSVFCVLFYRLGRYQLTSNRHRPFRGTLFYFIVSTGSALILGVWILVWNNVIAP